MKKKKTLIDTKLIGGYIDRYNRIYFCVAALIGLFEVIMLIRGIVVFNFNKTTHLLYFISYLYLFIASLIVALILLKNRNHSVSFKNLTIVVHIYSFVIISWATLVSYLDMTKGNTPIVYLTIVTVLAGLIVIHPAIYISYVGLSTLAIVIGNYFNSFEILKGDGYIINFAIFIIMAIIVAYRQYRVCLREGLIQAELKELTYTDHLTGLGNEAAYYKCTDRMENRIKEGNADFIVVLMDVNNVKRTNDTYGHRFGCHLIVTAGKTLPSVFTDARLFHIGGDEFVAVIEKNLDKFEEYEKNFDEKLEYRKIEFEGVELILSLARGYARYEKGDSYKDVLHKADMAMYKNKEWVKAKYNLTR